MLEETKPSEIAQCQSRNGASVSDKFALFNCIFLMGKFDHSDHGVKIGFISINMSSKYLDIELKASIISASISPERDITNSLG